MEKTTLAKINEMLTEFTALCDKWDLWDEKTCMYNYIDTYKGWFDTYAWQHAREFTEASQYQIFLEIKFILERVHKWAEHKKELAKESRMALKYLPNGTVKELPESTAKDFLEMFPEDFVIVA